MYKKKNAGNNKKYNDGKKVEKETFLKNVKNLERINENEKN